MNNHTNFNRFFTSAAAMGILGLISFSSVPLRAETDAQPRLQPPLPYSSSLQKYDTNGDGVISSGEFPDAATLFADLDRNSSGVLEFFELPPDPMRRPPCPMFHEGGPPRGRHGMDIPPPPPGGAHHMGRPGPQPRGLDGFKKDDVNNDGKVSRDEFSPRAELFDTLDINKDGSITEDEVLGHDNGPCGFGGPSPKDNFQPESNQKEKQ